MGDLTTIMLLRNLLLLALLATAMAAPTVGDLSQLATADSLAAESFDEEALAASAKTFELKAKGKECFPLDGNNGAHEEHLGSDKTEAQCAALCKAKEGCNYFVLGINDAKGECYWEYDDACKHSMEEASYNVYARKKGEAVTNKYGGNGGGVVDDRCARDAHIKEWKIKSGALVDNIVAVCSDGKELKKCGGNGGGGPYKVVQSSDHVVVRTGGLVDNFAGHGGHGGGRHTLQCPKGYRPTGVRFRCGALVDAVKLECTEQ